MGTNPNPASAASEKPGAIRDPNTVMIQRLLESPRWETAKAAREAGLYPYFRVVESDTSSEITVEGQRRVNFASNNYLALSTDPRVVEATMEATQRYGSGLGGSRFLGGTLDLHLELEEEIRDFYGAGRALVTTTGYGANLALLGGLLSKDDVAIVDAESHNSVQTGLVLSGAKVVKFRHNDIDHLREVLGGTSPQTGKVVVVDGVYSMGGDLALLPQIVEVCRSAPNTLLVVDEAHGIGVCGEWSRGAAEQFGVLDDVDFVTLTFSKSLGSCGGAIIGRRESLDVMQFLGLMNPFIFTASNTPGSVAAALAALRIIRSEPEHMAQLRRNVADFLELLERHGIRPNPSQSGIVTVPLRRGDDLSTLSVGQAILNAGVYANAVLFPAVPRDCGLLRFSFMASHTSDQLRFAADTLARTLRDHDQMPTPAGEDQG